MVPECSFAAPGTQTALPGTVVFIPHTFSFGTAGSVTFSTAGISAPTVAGWSESLLVDTDCSGGFTAGDVPLNGSLTRAAAQQVCLLLKVAAPATAFFGSQYQINLTAAFDYANAAPPLAKALSLSDLVLVGQASASGLVLSKGVDKVTAKPGEALTYTISYTNMSTGNLTNIIINDSTPAYTLFSSAGCGSLPASITACSVTTQPVAGSTGLVTWSLTGSLVPAANGSVSYTVTVQP
jgi:uncharacterized repeat protein (TIGR01451 family)